ncbi:MULTISPECIES: hypothetical protein [unclassified Roseovarius]|uniref:hypothetical protein n=1 Tax=unclassified Roseovarius TaxID=2614913 RepID=UPI00273E9255|nr:MULTISPECIES: hypothetical protein [unclassified Roseovarius]
MSTEKLAGFSDYTGVCQATLIAPPCPPDRHGRVENGAKWPHPGRTGCFHPVNNSYEQVICKIPLIIFIYFQCLKEHLQVMHNATGSHAKST